MRPFFRCIALMILVSGPGQTYSQTDSTAPGFMDQALIPAKLLAARHEYNDHNMRGALTIYREILTATPDNASALFGTAQCHYNLKKYDLALEYLEKAAKADPAVSGELDYWLGLANHRLANLDKAISYYSAYGEKQLKISENYQIAQEFIHQCEYAKEMMANPVPVKIENLGDAINSRYDDYTPSITADGSMLVFTSRRSDTMGGQIDERGDYKFFEDIYFSRYDPATGQWSNAMGLEGSVNTNTYDAVLSIAPAGNELFIYKNTVTTTGDIYLSELNAADKTWGLPQKMPRPVNTTYYEGSISMTADGETIYFISEREEGFGRGDIYVSHKQGEGNWSSPKNLGNVVNTDLDEKFVFIHPNGKTLYFASEGHQTMGSYDIFKTELVSGEWSVPVNLGFPINTVNEESTFSLTRDNKTLLIAAEYGDTFGERDIYRIDVANYPLISSGYDQSTFGQLEVHVVDDGGKPVKGTVIRIYGASSGKMITEVKTKGNGIAVINLQGHMKYRIEADKSGYTGSAEAEVLPKGPGGSATVVEIKLND